MRVVIDTNCLLASIPPLGAYYWLYEAFEQERFEWAVSNEILTEYDEKNHGTLFESYRTFGTYNSHFCSQCTV